MRYGVLAPASRKGGDPGGVGFRRGVACPAGGVAIFGGDSGFFGPHFSRVGCPTFFEGGGWMIREGPTLAPGSSCPPSRNEMGHPPRTKYPVGRHGHAETGSKYRRSSQRGHGTPHAATNYGHTLRRRCMGVRACVRWGSVLICPAWLWTGARCAEAVWKPVFRPVSQGSDRREGRSCSGFTTGVRTT